ncbi:MAG: toll/interleukin-1 receptor domain-containing protein [Bryobacteraceae bacterium]|nr:toll/interleukin-1 receptor domain-containing protein [Bryobacteraceae bacterium]
MQEAIQGATALLVVLSKASVESEWCKKELSSGLIRELDEKRIIVLPVLMEDCTIPIFLRDKIYADFRTDFDAGLKAVLGSVARVTSDSLMRIEGPEWHVDWSVDWGVDELTEHYFIYLTAIEQSATHAFSVLTQIHIIANDIANKRYEAMKAVDLDWFERSAVINMLAEGVADKNVRLRIEDEKAKLTTMILNDRKTGASFKSKS